METVSTMKLAVSPQSSPLGEPSRDPNSVTHPNTSSAGEPESSTMCEIETLPLLAVKDFLKQSVR